MTSLYWKFIYPIDNEEGSGSSSSSSGSGDFDDFSDFSFEPFGELPDLGRIGVNWALNPGLSEFSWLGHGPHENYADRLQSTPLGLWHSPVEDQAVPYPRPQETGNKEGVRWLALTDASGAGLLVVSEGAPVAASAIPYSMEALDAAQHTYELEKSPAVFLSLDARMMGLGNSSCGPGVLEEYAVPPVAYDLHLRLQPLTAGSDPTDFLPRHYTP